MRELELRDDYDKVMDLGCVDLPLISFDKTRV